MFEFTGQQNCDVRHAAKKEESEDESDDDKPVKQARVGGKVLREKIFFFLVYAE